MVFKCKIYDGSLNVEQGKKNGMRVLRRKADNTFIVIGIRI